jgi:hypothetical protein
MPDLRKLIPVVAWLWRIVGCPAIVPALFSVMLFDAPGSMQLSTILLATAIVTFPAVCFQSANQALRHYRSERPREAVRALAKPLASIAVILTSLAWIEIFQGGKLNG